MLSSPPPPPCRLQRSSKFFRSNLFLRTIGLYVTGLRTEENAAVTRGCAMALGVLPRKLAGGCRASPGGRSHILSRDQRRPFSCVQPLPSHLPFRHRFKRSRSSNPSSSHTTKHINFTTIAPHRRAVLLANTPPLTQRPPPTRSVARCPRGSLGRAQGRHSRTSRSSPPLAATTDGGQRRGRSRPDPGQRGRSQRRRRQRGARGRARRRDSQKLVAIVGEPLRGGRGRGKQQRRGWCYGRQW